MLWPAPILQEFRRNAFNTDSVDEALDLLEFCHKIVARSGLADHGTYLPKAIHPAVSDLLTCRLHCAGPVRQHSNCTQVDLGDGILLVLTCCPDASF